jgi:hypothetical protein
MEEDGDTSSISSPPQSPQNHIEEETIKVASRAALPGFGEGVAQQPASASAAPSAAATTPVPDATVTKPKRVRKPREPKPEAKDANGNVIVKEKKPRKPREPKVKAEGATTAAPRKRQKTEEKAAAAAVAGDVRQSTLTGMQFYPPANPATNPLPPTQQPARPPQQPQHQPSQPQHSQPQPQQQLAASSDTLMRNSQPPRISTPTPRPFSSGQNYDPVRGQNYDPIRGAIDTSSPRPPIMSNGALSAHPSPHINRASASPSITSLIEPNTANASAVTYNTAQSKPQTAMFVNPPPLSISSNLNPSLPSQQSNSSPKQPPPPVISTTDGAMDIDVDCDAPKQPTLKKASSKASSTAPTPKPSKPASPPSKSLVKAGTGSGLLSSSSLFGGPSTSTDSEPKGVDIELRISLRPEGGNAINIAQEIAKKYGRDAINPRAAAHRERLLQVAAQANRLENGSADDNMSVDLMSELDGDSNIEMGGMEEAEAAPKLNASGEPVRKRRKKQEEYDKEDDFIDDTELAWQEQAAVAKDGFFVYSGPLIQPGQLAQVESAAPARGRGTGRGRGRGRGAAAAGGTTHAALAEKGKDKDAASTNGSAAGTTTTTRKPRGGGPGSRGGKVAGGAAAPRKSRITKADQEKRDAEKAEREKVMTLAGGAGVSAPTTTATTTPMSNTTPAKMASSVGKESSVGPGMVLQSQPAYSPPPSTTAMAMGQQAQGHGVGGVGAAAGQMRV